jgi:4-hydroxy-4-methyl-2-oxoglutarate aldolase
VKFRHSHPTPPPPLLPAVSDEEFRELGELDSCSVANAIERFNVRLRNEGYTEGDLVCRFPALPPMLGYAFTIQVRSGAPPTKGHVYFENTSWWEALLAVPVPRILVVQDMDRHPGAGALIDKLHVEILQSLGCVGVVTNGAVRDLPRIAGLNFQLYSATLSVSHSYSHLVHIGGRAQIGGIDIAPGDLLHGDSHGVIRVPRELAARIPRTARALRQKEDEVAAYLRSPDCTLDGLRSLLES